MIRVNAERGASIVESLESRRHLSAVIGSVTFSGTVAAPLVTIEGSGFGSKPKALKTPLGTGADYAKNNFLFSDLSPTPLSWIAGRTGNYIGLTVAKFSGKLITYGFGSGLAEEIGNYSFNDGDSFEVEVNGATAFGTVALDGSNTIPSAPNIEVTVTSKGVPATLAAGAKLKGSLQLTITNAGNLAAAGPQSITLYLADATTEFDFTTGFGLTLLKTLGHGGTFVAGSTHKSSIKLTGVAPAAGLYQFAILVKLPDGITAMGYGSLLTVT